MTRRNFFGVAAGVSALPTDANAILNAYYLTVEPQIDLISEEYHWRLGLGAPLQFELLDTRGAFEVCLGEARQVRATGLPADAVTVATANCLMQKKDRMTEHTGQLRRADWDSASDFAKVIRYLVIGGQEEPFYLSLGRLYDQSFGHGTVVRSYNPNIDYNTARLGANLDFNRSFLGAQAMANDLVRPDVLGLMGFVRPFRPFTDSVPLRSLSLGVSWVHGIDQPRRLKYERGLFGRALDQPLPEVTNELGLVAASYGQVTVMGFDVETKLLRTTWGDMKIYVDYQKMLDHGAGTTLGTLWRFSAGQPAWYALRARAEASLFDADYLPNYFDTFHDVFQNQYLPASYQGANGIRYFPTKLEYLEASAGGRKRVGGYFDLTNSFRDTFTFGLMARAFTPYGSPKDGAFMGPKLPDYGSGCTTDATGALTCANTVTLEEQGFKSVKFHVELPFRRFLQAFASYEVFSSNAEDGLGALKFDGDNEVLFSGARLMILPIFFIQAEARRYFFVQRISDVDVDALTFQQDQNFHSRWTFAINASLGYEF
jgi:hypothetical protein